MSSIFILLALVSEWIYNQEMSTIPWDLQPLHMSTRVGVLHDGNTCVVAFRGTDSITDLFDDLMSQAYQSCDSAGVLSVFMESYNDLDMDAIRHSVMTSGCKKLYVTGHSLGGAMAEISSSLDEFSPLSPTVVTFGGPRTCCGNKNIKQRTTRVVNGRDPIPSLPERVGTHTIGHCSSFAIELPSFKSHNDIYWPSLSENYNIFDHEISRYINELTSYINQKDY